jgi:hypothetical protein
LNFNTLTEEVTREEGKKVALPISQVKEVVKITVRKLANADSKEVERFFAYYRGK